MESATAPRRRVTYEFCDACVAHAREWDKDPDGWIFDPATRLLRPCECRGRAISRAQWRAVEREIPRKLRGASIDRAPLVNLAPALKAGLTGYVAELKDAAGGDEPPTKGMWMVGPVGTGKSAAAAWIAREAHTAGLRVAFWSLNRLLAQLREGYADGAEHTPQQLIDALIGRTDLLILDDVGVPRATAWALEALHDLLDGLYLAERAVIATSDLDERAYDDRFEERLGSRLSELCSEPVRFTGPDLRRPHLVEADVEPSVRVASREAEA